MTPEAKDGVAWKMAQDNARTSGGPKQVKLLLLERV